MVNSVKEKCLSVQFLHRQAQEGDYLRNGAQHSVSTKFSISDELEDGFLVNSVKEKCLSVQFLHRQAQEGDYLRNGAQHSAPILMTVSASMFQYSGRNSSRQAGPS